MASLLRSTTGIRFLKNVKSADMPGRNRIFAEKQKTTQSDGLLEARKRGFNKPLKTKDTKFINLATDKFNFRAVSKYEQGEREREAAGIPAKVPAKSSLVRLDNEDKVNFEAELRRRRKRTRTKFAGESGGSGSGGYGGSTQLG